MRATFWGTRGSLPSPGPETAEFGGNTACVAIETADPTHLVVLDAGTGIRRLGYHIPDAVERIDILLTHLHMDHIVGLGFFGALFRSDLEVHLWGPASPLTGLRRRLSRYLSPPLFPVRLHDLPCRPTLHELPMLVTELPSVEVQADLVCHPGQTVGYRLDDGQSTLAYLPDHEPALGSIDFPNAPEWTSGFALAHGVDVLIHDAQYTAESYPDHVGWGHSALEDAIAFARLAEVDTLVCFHHDPGDDDAVLEARYRDLVVPGLTVVPAREGRHIDTVADIALFRST